MNKITKVGLGLAAATLALTATAVPATAATADASNDTISATAAGDRIEGKIVFYTPGGNGTTPGHFVLREPADGEWVRGSYPKSSTWEGAAARTTATYSLPAPGAGAGPIISNDNGLCLESVNGGRMRGAVCDGSADQNFQFNGNRLENSSNLAATASYTSTTPGGPWDVSYTSFSAPYAQSLQLPTTNMTPVLPFVEPVAITGPTAGSTVPTLTPTVEGVGEPGATIVIRDADGNQIGTGTVGADGTWSIVTDELPFGDTTLIAEQTTTDGQTSSDSVNFVIADPAEVPIADPLVAGGTLTALAAAAATVIIRRRTA